MKDPTPNWYYDPPEDYTADIGPEDIEPDDDDAPDWDGPLGYGVVSDEGAP